MSDHIGPSLWHGREINSCTRCKYLRSVLRKSGRKPDYEYFCTHPVMMAGDRWDAVSPLIDKMRQLHPERADAFEAHMKKHHAERKEFARTNGEFISNDEVTPETPEWCPVVAEKKARKQ